MPDPGTLLAERYRLVERLGAGGMGEVWAATDEREVRPVAVKLLAPGARANLEAVGRFVREARTAMGVEHRSVVRTLDLVVPEDGDPFIVLERLEGESLEDRLARGPLPPTEAARIVAEVLGGLEAVHAAGIVHRDVKPANVFLCGGPWPSQPKLLDFGIAKPLGDRGLTRTGTIVGTPVYMAPEQIREEPVDARTDVYGAGATLYEALTGRPPFVGDGARLMRDVLVAELPPVTTLRPGLDPGLAAIVHRALAKDPGLRFASAAEMRERLLAFTEVVSGPRAAPDAPTVEQADSPPPTPSPIPRAPRRAPPKRRELPVLLAVFAGLALVAIGAGGGLAVWLRPRPRLATVVREREAPPPPSVSEAPSSAPAPTASGAPRAPAPAPSAQPPAPRSDVRFKYVGVTPRGYRAYMPLPYVDDVTRVVNHPAITRCFATEGLACRTMSVDVDYEPGGPTRHEALVNTNCTHDTASCVMLAMASHPPLLRGSIPIHTRYNFRIER